MFFAFFFAGFFALILGGCPLNSIELRLNESICYSFHPSLSQFVIAERECNSFGATLVSVKDKYTNVYVTQLANLYFKHLEVEEIWTNGHRLVDSQTFRWTDGEEIQYKNWREKSIKESGDKDCVAINLEKGLWKMENCFARLPFVCEFHGNENLVVPASAVVLEKENKASLQEILMIPFITYHPSTITSTSPSTTTTMNPTTDKATDEVTESPTTTSSTSSTTDSSTSEATTINFKSCSDDWTYFNVTGFCYKVFTNKHWKDAENKCVQEGAHLTSIHSKDESTFVATLANPTSLSHLGWEGQPWIGLYTKDHNLNWHWTDGTLVDYLSWAPGDPNLPGEESCGQVFSSNFHNIGAGIKFADFNNYNCETTLANFICKKSP